MSADFEAQAKAFADQIEAELADGRLNFPVSMEVSLRIKRLADDPATTLDQITTVVQAEPVLSAKTLRMANTVALNPYGAQIDTVRDAVQLGYDAILLEDCCYSSSEEYHQAGLLTMRVLASQVTDSKAFLARLAAG